MTEKMERRPIAVQVSGVKKMYKLGQIGGGTLRADLESWWAKKRGKEDPNTKIGEGERSRGDTFMALNGVDITIYQGEAVGIIGSNGAGKSTFLKLLSRVTAPTEGDIDIYGRIASMLEVGTGFNGELTGRENIYMNGAILGMTKSEIDAKMEAIIEFSEVREFIDTPVKRYSSGMFVKLAFSVAAHLDAEIMIMDEVLAVGDMAFQKKCLTKMREAAKQDGRTVLYVSHNMNTIRQLCDRCIVLDRGKVIFNGEVEEAISQYLHAEKPQLDSTIQLESESTTGCRMRSFEFLGKENAIIPSGENIKFRMRIDSDRIYSNVHLRVMAYFSDGLPVFMSSTQNKGFMLNESQNSISGVINVSNLAPGEYWFKLALYLVNEFGNEFHLDIIDKQVGFQINDNITVNNMEWLHSWWGHIRQADIELLKQ